LARGLRFLRTPQIFASSYQEVSPDWQKEDLVNGKEREKQELKKRFWTNKKVYCGLSFIEYRQTTFLAE